MKIEFSDIGAVSDRELKFAVISTMYKGKWLYVKHKDRNSWEIPGGHREPGEIIDETAKRELFEETGCNEVDLVPICDYSMDDSVNKIFGRLFFARIKEIGQLPISEVGEVKLFDNLPKNLTYLEIQPKLFKKTLSFLKDCENLHLN
jgi:8-oxo-dGTP diphosphatase